MSLLTATLRLYANAARQATVGFAQTLLALPVLVLGYFAVGVLMPLIVHPLLGGDGMLSGIASAVVQDLFVGTYLSLLSVWVVARRALLFRHLKQHAGNLFWPVLTIMFILMLAQFAMAMVPSRLELALFALIAIVFNPVPEVLYINRDEGLDAMSRAMRFMQRNWPEWIGAQLPAIVFFGLWALVRSRGPSAMSLLVDLQSFGPFLSFIDAGAPMARALTTTGHPLFLLWLTALLAFTHWYFLWRGHLYSSLDEGNRRLRSWRARM